MGKNSKSRKRENREELVYLEVSETQNCWKKQCIYILNHQGGKKELETYVFQQIAGKVGGKGAEKAQKVQKVETNPKV